MDDDGFEGGATARIDEKGRLKLPAPMKAFLEQKYGPELFVTSVDGRSVLIYPKSEWTAHVREIVGGGRLEALAPPRRNYLLRVNAFGQSSEVDAQGRVVIQQRLRESADMTGEVTVVGQDNHLEVWNTERLNAKLDAEPFTDDDYQALVGK